MTTLACTDTNQDLEQLEVLRQQVQLSYRSNQASDQTLEFVRQYLNYTLQLAIRDGFVNSSDLVDPSQRSDLQQVVMESLDLGASDPKVFAAIGDQIDAFVGAKAICSNDPCQIQIHQSADPIEMFSGQFTHECTDVVIKGAGIDFTLQRTYKSLVEYNGPFGSKWDHSYNLWLREVDTALVRSTGALREDGYIRHPKFGQAGFNYWVPPDGVHGLIKESGPSYVWVSAEGGKYTYEQDPSHPQMHRIKTIEDRFGNYLYFTYDDGHLSKVEVNSPKRSIAFTYDTLDRIICITDYVGRNWFYNYDDFGDLVSFTLPATDRYPFGLSTYYEYSSAVWTSLQHYLTRIIDPAGRLFLENEYGTDRGSYNYARVTRQRQGSGESSFDYQAVVQEFEYDYSDAEKPSVQVNYVGRNGQGIHLVYNRFGNLLLKEEYILQAGIRRLVQWRNRFNRDGALVATLTPEGTLTQWYFGRDDFLRVHNIGDDEVATSGDLTDQARMTFCNLLAVIRREKAYNFSAMNLSRGIWGNFFPDPLSAVEPGDTITKYTYEADYQQILTVSDPRFTESADPRYTEQSQYSRTLIRHEYTGSVGNASKFLSRIRYPDLTMPDGTLLSNITEEFPSYDSNGRILQHVDKTGVLTVNTYFSSADGTKEGYLQSTVNDPGGLSVRTEFEVNDVGIVTAIHQPKSLGAPPGHFITRYTINELNQTVQTELSPPFSYVTKNFYDPSGLLERIEKDLLDENRNPILGGVEVQTFCYDDEKHLIRETRGGSDLTTHLVTKHVYDEAGLLKVTISPRGTRTTRRYDERMIEIAVTRGSGSQQASTTRAEYDGDGRKTVSVSGRGYKTKYVYNSFGKTQYVIDAVGNITGLTYDKAGNVIVERFIERDAAGNLSLLTRTEYDYDESSNRISEGHNFFLVPLPMRSIDTDYVSSPGPGALLVAKYFHNKNGNIVRSVNARGQETTISYDALDRKTAETDAIGNKTVFSYDPNGNIIRNDVVEVVVDPSSGHVVGEQVFPTSAEFDELDRAYSIKDSLGNTVRHFYDSRNSLVRIVDSLGNVQQYEYDIYKRKRREISELTSTGLGGGGQLDPIVCQFEYDPNGNIIAHVDGNGNRIKQCYDPLDRISIVEYPDGSTSTSNYDSDDFLIEARDNNGLIRRLTIDPLGRISWIDIDRSVLMSGITVEGETFEEYVYDGKGRCLQERNDFAKITKKVDSLGRVYEETIEPSVPGIATGQTFTLGRTFDELNAVETLTYPGLRIVRYHKDQLNRLIRLENEAKGLLYLGSNVFPGRYDIAQIEYVGQRRSRLILGNNTTTEFQYDGSGKTIEISHKDSSTSLLTIQQLYDAMGNMRFRNDITSAGSQGEEFKYDSVYQVTKAEPNNVISIFDPSTFAPFSSSPIGSIPDRQTPINAVIGPLAQDPLNPTFIYDFASNRIIKDFPIHSVVNYTTNDLNEYTQVDTSILDYDKDGNLNSDSQFVYFFDARNLLVRVNDKSTGKDLALFYHDSRGRRVAEQRGGIVTLFVWDGPNELEEYKGGGISTQFVYLGGADTLCQMVEGGSEYWYHKDLVGSTRLLTDETGVVAGSYSYDLFGTIVRDNGPYNPFRFAGRRYDFDLQMYNFRAREYSPALGRFIQRDPKGISGSGNLYLYALNNPLKLVDPLGTEPSEVSQRLQFGAGASVGALKNFYGLIEMGTISWMSILHMPLNDWANEKVRQGGVWWTSLFNAIGEGRFVDWVVTGVEQRMAVTGALYAQGKYFEGGELFGDTAMNAYMVTKSATDLSLGTLRFGGDVISYGPVTATKGLGYAIRYWATNLEDGIKPVGMVKQGVLRGSPYENYAAYYADVKISQMLYSAERMIRSGNATSYSKYAAYQNAIGTNREPMEYGNLAQQIVNDMLNRSANPVLSSDVVQNRAFGTNAKGNPIRPDYRISRTVIDLTTPGEAGKALKYPAANVLEPYTGTVRFQLGTGGPIPVRQSGAEQLQLFFGLQVEF